MGERAEAQGNGYNVRPNMHEGAQVVTEEQTLGEQTAYARVTSAGKPRVNQWGSAQSCA